MLWLRSIRPTCAKALGAAILLLSGVVGLSGQVANIREYPIPTPDSSPYGEITAGPDGALWLTAYCGSIVRASVVNPEPFGPAAFIKTDRFRDAANWLPYVGIAHRAMCLW